MVILNNFWIIRKTILQFILVVYIGFSDYILGLSWYSDQDRSKIDPFKKYYLDPNRSILKQFLVENKYHGITGSFRPKILTFRVISWKKFSIIYLRDHLTVSRSGGYSLSISLKSSALRTLSLRILETFVLETFWRAAPSCSEIIGEDHWSQLLSATSTMQITRQNWLAIVLHFICLRLQMISLVNMKDFVWLDDT